MSANSLQLLTSPEGDLLSAATDGDGPSLTVERGTVDDGFQGTLTFTRGSDRLILVSAIRYGDEGKIVQSSITADGRGVRYRLTVDFAEDPGAFFSGGKLDAALTVHTDGVTHHGRFDGETWHSIGLEQAPRLPDLLTAGAGPLIAPLRPALDVLVAQFHRSTGGTFPSSPGRPPTLVLAGPGTVQTFSWWSERACKIGCAIAQIATATDHDGSGRGSRLPTLARGRRSLTDSGGGGTSSGHRLGPVQAFIPHAGRLRDESAIGRARRHGLSVTFRSDVPHGPRRRRGRPPEPVGWRPRRTRRGGDGGRH